MSKKAAVAAALLFALTSSRAFASEFTLSGVTAGDIKASQLIIPAPAAPLKEWTIMAFLNGNNNLEHHAITKLSDMEDVGSSDRVNIVAELGKTKGSTNDGQQWSGSRRYYLTADGMEYGFSSRPVQELGTADMGDWRHLADFVKWAKMNYPAKKYMLIVFGHGSSWMSMDKPLTKGMLYDDESGNHVTSVELRKVFETAGPVDLLFMDSCLMQDLSALYEIRKHAAVVVGSQDTIQANGVMYKFSLKRVREQPEMTAEEAAEFMIFPGGRDSGIAQPVFTLSAVRTAALGKLASRLDTLAARLLAGRLADYRAARDAAFRPDADYSFQGDLGHFLKALGTSADTAVRGAAGEAFDILSNETVLYNHAADKEKEYGLSAYLPAKKFKKEFRALSFAEDTRWDDLAGAGIK
ncbi:MAG: clostripain-related cysteine peptidase [Elusimicrobiales bacterium]|nr:clostripain-related cysteine peptidase [Elusimicrobiales bacterium]